MLGRLAYVHQEDVRWSKEFITQLQKKKIFRSKTALDVGGGIGRVASHVLKICFDNVDMLEQNARFVEASKENFAKNRIRTRFCLPIQ